MAIYKKKDVIRSFHVIQLIFLKKQRYTLIVVVSKVAQ